MKHIKKALSYSIAGSIGLTVIASLNGCSEQPAPPHQVDGGSMLDAAAEQSQFLVIEQTGTAPDTYKVVEKHPTSGPTRAILRDMEGQERFLSEEELRLIAEQEAAKVEAGTSNLTQDPGMHSGGLSLGETILAAAAGSLIGGMLANRLMSNSNFQRTQQRYGGGRPTTSISRPLSNQSAQSKPRSGFFGGSRSGTSSSRGIFGSFGG
ncbi:MAG: hypothetical protein KDI68_15345 [Gammaproteobacteria bacterium]|nr:hypothetical protein [Gammaproteobacteria bacterium]